jgi:hypothetical protein
MIKMYKLKKLKRKKIEMILSYHIHSYIEDKEKKNRKKCKNKNMQYHEKREWTY